MKIKNSCQKSAVPQNRDTGHVEHRTLNIERRSEEKWRKEEKRRGEEEGFAPTWELIEMEPECADWAGRKVVGASGARPF